MREIYECHRNIKTIRTLSICIKYSWQTDVKTSIIPLDLCKTISCIFFASRALSLLYHLIFLCTYTLIHVCDATTSRTSRSNNTFQTAIECLDQLFLIPSNNNVSIIVPRRFRLVAINCFPPPAYFIMIGVIYGRARLLRDSSERNNLILCFRRDWLNLTPPQV